MVTVLASLMGSVTVSLNNQALAHPSAERQLERATHQIHTQPRNQALYIDRAYIHIMSLKYDLAMKDLKKADELGEASNTAYAYALLFKAQKDYYKAQPYFDRYLGAHPDDIKVLEMRAEIFQKLNEKEKAIADYTHLTSLRRGALPKHFIALARLVRNDLPASVNQAARVIDLGLNRFSTSTSLLRFAIDLDKQQGEYARAVVRHDKLKNHAGRLPEWHHEHGQLLESNGDLIAALDQYVAAYKLLKDNPKLSERIISRQDLRMKLEMKIKDMKNDKVLSSVADP